MAYCEGRALCHPLVSPVNAEDWTGSPPMWFAVGEVSVLDGCKIVAKRASEQGVFTVWEEYEDMPHIFPYLPGIRQTPQVQRCLREWAEFCQECALTPKRSRSVGGSRVTKVHYPAGHQSVLDSITALDYTEARELMEKGMMDIENSFQRQQSG